MPVFTHGAAVISGMTFCLQRDNGAFLPHYAGLNRYINDYTIFCGKNLYKISKKGPFYKIFY